MYQQVLRVESNSFSYARGVQIRYTKLDGMKCIRIISREQKATRDREQAELAANVDVLGLNAVQKSAKIAQKGEYTAGMVPACSFVPTVIVIGP